MVDVTIPAYLPEVSEREENKLEELLSVFGNIRRRAYMMMVRGKPKSDILKGLRKDTGFNSWYVNSAYRTIKDLPSMGVVFGGKKSKKELEKDKIDKKEWHKRRNSFIASDGEGRNHGNRCLRVVEKEESLKLRVSTGIREWIYIDLFIPEKYLERYGHLLDGSEPYRGVIGRREDEGYECKITVHPECKVEERDRVLTIDTNSGHLDWAVVEKKTKKLVETGRINTSELADASTNKTENLLYELAHKIGDLAEHYESEVVIGKLNTGNFSSPSSGANRSVKSIPHYKFRKILEYKLPMRGIPFKVRSEAYTSKLGRELGEMLGLDIHKSSAYAFALKVIEYHFFMLLHGVLSDDRMEAGGRGLSVGSGLTALVKSYALGNGNLAGLATLSIGSLFDLKRPPDEETTPQYKVEVVPVRDCRPDSTMEVEV